LCSPVDCCNNKIIFSLDETVLAEDDVMARFKKYTLAKSLCFSMAVAVMLPSSTWAKPKGQVLHKFIGPDGLAPVAALTIDTSGNVYGTTLAGGERHRNCSAGCGLVFQLQPNADGSWTENVLYKFTGDTDGSSPSGNLAIDGDGNIYGATQSGGGNAGCGTAFQLSPNGDGTWNESTIHEFDLCIPSGGLTLDSDGNLYGTTPQGQSQGTVFELTKSEGWQEKILHSFTGGRDGAIPQGGPLVFDGGGNLYGTTSGGGVYGNGTVYQLVPQLDGTWIENVLYNFTGGYEGSSPSGGVVFDTDGNLYGTTRLGGLNNVGIVFRLTPSAPYWTISVVHAFTGNKDGGSPSPTALSMDSSENLYGTTQYGGRYQWGTAFMLTRQSSGRWVETVLHSFTNGVDGGVPYNGAQLDAAGNLYVTTLTGGTSRGFGTVDALFKNAGSAFSGSTLK
jgi:uncharacterized repeat protein (TIGR03803 family)